MEHSGAALRFPPSPTCHLLLRGRGPLSKAHDLMVQGGEGLLRLLRCGVLRCRCRRRDGGLGGGCLLRLLPRRLRAALLLPEKQRPGHGWRGRRRGGRRRCRGRRVRLAAGPKEVPAVQLLLGCRRCCCCRCCGLRRALALARCRAFSRSRRHRRLPPIASLAALLALFPKEPGRKVRRRLPTACWCRSRPCPLRLPPACLCFQLLAEPRQLRFGQIPLCSRAPGERGSALAGQAGLGWAAQP